jgi:hypothetical protein
MYSPLQGSEMCSHQPCMFSHTSGIEESDRGNILHNGPMESQTEGIFSTMDQRKVRQREYSPQWTNGKSDTGNILHNGPMESQTEGTFSTMDQWAICPSPLRAGGARSESTNPNGQDVPMTMMMMSISPFGPVACGRPLR